ncbi:MAG TPA: hypothetical protein VH134_01825 [Candidatus Dormibacteraeota bacterium]|jgi:hypothetical protein|nr:hypothetical protein [Candidatus Dormibacteraeota bacterium]
MPKSDAERVHWATEPAEHDYPAASAYLGLLLPLQRVAATVDALRKASVTHHRANDLLRASGLPHLPPDNPSVARDLAKARRGDALSPVLLVCGDLAAGRPLCIADGYHRVCASYHIDEDADIPARMVDLPKG